MAGVYKGLTVKIGADTTGLSQALNGIDRQARGLTREMKAVDKALRFDPKNTELLKQKFEGLGKQVEMAGQRLDALKQAASKGEGSMSPEAWSTLQREIAVTQGSLDRYTAQLREANAQYAAAESGLGQVGARITEFGDKLNPIGEKLESIGGKMTAAFTAPAVAAGIASVKTAMDFETSLAKVSTLADESVMSMGEIGQGARDLAVEYGKSASEINEALYQAMSASVDTADALGFVETATRLSKAGFTESATAVDVLTTAINAYGLSADEAEHVSDVLVNTQNLGKTTVNELASSMGNVIPTAAAYNVNLENLATSYAVMTKQGINTANSTTYINGMLTELANNGSTVNGVLQDMTGQTFGQLMAGGASLGDVIQMLSESVDGDTEAFAQLWDNTRAGKGALAIANAGAEEFNETLGSMVDASGIVDEALEKLGGTTQASLDKARAAVEDAAISVGQVLLPIVTDAAMAVRDAAEAFNGLSDEEKAGIVQAAALVAGIGPVLTVMGKLMTSVSGIGKGISNFAVALAKLDMATGGAANGLKKVTDAAGNSTVAAEKASVAMGALKGAAIGLAIAGIALIVKGLMDYKAHLDKVEKATDGLKESMGRLGGGAAAEAFGDAGKAAESYRMQVDDAIEAHARLADEIGDLYNDTESNGALADHYLQAIKDAQDGYDGSAEACARLQAAVDGYNQVTGNSIEITNTETGELSTSTAALDANTEAWKANARAQAAQEAYKEIFKENAKAADAQRAAADALKDANAELLEANRSGDLAAIDAAKVKADDAKAAWEDATRVLQESDDALAQAEHQMVDYNEAMLVAKQSTDDFRNAMEWSEDGVSSFDELAGDLGADVDDLASSLAAAGVKSTDMASLGRENFARLYRSANGDCGKIGAALKTLDGLEIDPKDVTVTDNGTIEFAKDGVERIIDLDVPDKSFSVSAYDAATETINGVKKALQGLSDYTLNIFAQKNAAGGVSAGGIRRNAAGGINGIVTQATLTNVGWVGEAGDEAVFHMAHAGGAIVPLSDRRHVRPFAQAVAAEMGSAGDTYNNQTYIGDVMLQEGTSAAAAASELARALRIARRS